ncbi:hypothetical protein [Mesorhizobium sp. M0959]|uniref:hypothetical protein n=1 Tax=unclassified Mesorhizobium TaxID=325217 RepID=UPI0033394142
MIFGPLFMILFLAVLIAAGSLSSAGSAAREDNGATASHAAGRTPLDILKERFARGEIDK